MKRSKFSLRKLLVAVAFAGAMGFGAMQAVASGTAEKAQANSCSWVCESECPGFGGSYIAGVCYCCG